ncbi:hypothetical protein [Paenibacillus sp. UNC499MF]|uniref:hypothetical protein n=1 Tax=Paenibacillus sp. UNC499MF TaxID=1502751 RepID=UPI0011B0DED0|nr:hypothetical protein [Paenibacillus sp. UNC499MF]
MDAINDVFSRSLLLIIYIPVALFSYFYYLDRDFQQSHQIIRYRVRSRIWYLKIKYMAMTATLIIVFSMLALLLISLILNKNLNSWIMMEGAIYHEALNRNMTSVWTQNKYFYHTGIIMTLRFFYYAVTLFFALLVTEIIRTWTKNAALAIILTFIVLSAEIGLLSSDIPVKLLFYYVVPNIERWLSPSSIIWGVVYLIGVIAALILIGERIFEKQDFKAHEKSEQQ